MSTLHYNSYRVKVATKGEEGQEFQKNGYVVCVRPLIWFHVTRVFPSPKNRVNGGPAIFAVCLEKKFLSSLTLLLSNSYIALTKKSIFP